ncbi:hypothetical protein OU995_14700 [Roseateles sp. SL47]|uniref:hypothetical protein n=1 Tax=Roseateles sp. SL47 TaxID=2995138 RepID=UPI00226E0128|nr:hypothetical protein [Roseateles sp. SL47]WAC70866.1 hypothetical protein OU995_14700 [Roseateles sp. SL47]
MNMKPTGRQRALGLLLAALMAVFFIWLINSGAKQVLEWLMNLPNKRQGDLHTGVGVLLALVLPLAAYRIRRARKKSPA